MVIPRQINWGTRENVLHEILKKTERINSLGYKWTQGNFQQVVSTTTTTTTFPELSTKAIAWYDMEETSGSVLVDEKGVYNGTIGTNVTIDQTGLPGQAHAYAAAAINYYDYVADNDVFSLDNLKSISIWFNLTTMSTASRIIGKANEWYIEIATAGYIRVRCYDTSGTSIWHGRQSASGLITTGTDYHLVINIIDAVNKQFEIYLDDVLLSANDSSSGTMTAIANNANSVNIGGEAGSSAKPVGTISQFVLYNNSLTSTGIATLYNSGSGISYGDID
jgi:hypothetical protein